MTKGKQKSSKKFKWSRNIEDDEKSKNQKKSLYLTFHGLKKVNLMRNAKGQKRTEPSMIRQTTLNAVQSVLNKQVKKKLKVHYINNIKSLSKSLKRRTNNKH